jgi:hypothetical protein
MHSHFIRRAALSLPIACALVNASCAFVKLRENVERIERFATVSGTVEGGMPGTATVVVLLNADTDAQLDSFIVGARGKYYFVVPPGAYRIAAFTDAVPDFRYDPAKERGVWYGAPDTLRLGEGEARSDYRHHGRRERCRGRDAGTRRADPGNREMHGLPDVNVGTVAPIDDPRFTPENGDLACGSRWISRSQSWPGSIFSSRIRRTRPRCCSSTAWRATRATSRSSSRISIGGTFSPGCCTTRRVRVSIRSAAPPYAGSRCWLRSTGRRTSSWSRIRWAAWSHAR